jgi:protein-tyrosine phosphatase
MKNLIKISFLTITLLCVFSCKTQQFSTPEFGKREGKDIQIKKVNNFRTVEILKILMEEPKRRKTVQKRKFI